MSKIPKKGVRRTLRQQLFLTVWLKQKVLVPFINPIKRLEVLKIIYSDTKQIQFQKYS